MHCIVLMPGQLLVFIFCFSTTVALPPGPTCPPVNEYLITTGPHKTPLCQEGNKEAVSAFTTVPRGQLGNHLHAYALLVGLQARYPDRHFFTSSETGQYLRRYFRMAQLLIQSIDRLCLCRTHLGVASRPWEWRFWNSGPDLDFVEDIDREEMNSGHGWILWPDRGFLFNEYQSGVKLLEDTDLKIRNSLVFKTHFIEKAKLQLKFSLKKWMSKNKKRVKKSDITGANITYVAIHHRRGDHLKYERVMKIPHITLAYLGPTMDLYRAKYKTVVFLYVSDDKEWAKQHMSRDKDVVFSWSPSNRVLATGEDLALLSLSNHTIMTRGSYSFWASKLSGGSYIRPCMLENTATQVEKRERRERGKPWPLNPLDRKWQDSLWKDC